MNKKEELKKETNLELEETMLENNNNELQKVEHTESENLQEEKKDNTNIENNIEISKETNQNIEKHKNNKQILIIILIVILLLCFGIVGLILLNNQEPSNSENHNKEEIKEDNEETNKEENEEDVEEPKNENTNTKYSELIKLSNQSWSVQWNEQLYGNRDIGDDPVYSYGYDGYYIVKSDNEYYLKRNKKTVSKIEKNTLKVYKDKTDQNSKYIAVTCVEYSDKSVSCDISREIKEEYSYLNNLDIGGIIFNINNGKNKLFKGDVYVQFVGGIEKAIFTYESVGEGDCFISLEDFSLICDANKKVWLTGNGARGAFGDSFYSESSKYIVVKSLNKYGLYDYNFNKVIDFIYDDLETISEDLLIAQKGNKFGVIDSSNNIILDFEYDGIEKVEDYFVVVKSGKLGVIDKSGKTIVPFDFSVPTDMKFSLRLCCASKNSFSIDATTSTHIVISYIDTTRSSNYSYIILNKNGSYLKLNHISRAYNFTEDFYYYGVEDDSLNLYNKDGSLYKSLKCNNNYTPVYSADFVNKEVLKYSCEMWGENYQYYEEEFYYNVKLDKEVIKEEIEIFSTTDNYLNIYTIDGEVGVYGRKNDLLLKLDKDDTFEPLGDIYKVVKNNGKVEYYQLNYIY